MAQLFDKCGGYRALYSFTYATLVHLGTISFCKRFIPYREDPLGKTTGQMIGAARSGRQNTMTLASCVTGIAMPGCATCRA